MKTYILKKDQPSDRVRQIIEFFSGKTAYSSLSRGRGDHQAPLPVFIPDPKKESIALEIQKRKTPLTSLA